MPKKQCLCARTCTPVRAITSTLTLSLLCCVVRSPISLSFHLIHSPFFFRVFFAFASGFAADFGAAFAAPPASPRASASQPSHHLSCLDTPLWLGHLLSLLIDPNAFAARSARALLCRGHRLLRSRLWRWRRLGWWRWRLCWAAASPHPPPLPPHRPPPPPFRGWLLGDRLLPDHPISQIGVRLLERINLRRDSLQRRIMCIDPRLHRLDRRLLICDHRVLLLNKRSQRRHVFL